MQGLLDPRTLSAVGDPISLPEGLSVLLVPDAGGRARARLLRTLAGRSAVAGPARPWLAVEASYDRAIRALDLRDDDATYDTEEHLADLILAADREAVADLRDRVLAAARRAPARHAAEARRDAARLAAPPGPPRRHRGRALRAPADRALPDGPAARAVRRPARRPRDHPRPDARAGLSEDRRPSEAGADDAGTPPRLARKAHHSLWTTSPRRR